ncbi:MAG: NAD(P)/FAD-dependent oxidoreductase [Cytophagales bacterium]|nr:NAD(P)/FAD-dependent oxidoreductase [Cytophagales bacterium]
MNTNKKLNIGIVGAGFAGLSSAKVLREFGHKVTVFEKNADVGGVWSAARRYPGLTTQNVRSTYSLSDFPYPKDYPEWPSGEQVQRYLDSYVKHFGFEDVLRLNTEVTKADVNAQTGGWTVTTHDSQTGENQTTHSFDYLVICNGIFSTPMIPDYAGAESFKAAGGRVCHTSEFTQLSDAKDKNVVVVGYGKSSCDVAQAVASTAKSTTVVARHLIWKVPKKLMNVLNYKYLLLTRLGEALFKYIHLKGVEKFLHGAGLPVRNSMLGQVQWVVTKQCKLRQLDLVPPMPFQDIARSTVSLVTDGFYENVASGRIKVLKGTSISGLTSAQGQLSATLDSGKTIPADIVVCGTGWNQNVPFLSQDVLTRITDAAGNFRLYRSMLPINVPNLAFNGYNSSFFSQLNCEMGALWIADLLAGSLVLPSVQEQNRIVDGRLAWMEERTDGKHSKGTNIIPFSVHHIDELLSDMRLPLPALVRFKQWLAPIDPCDFARVTKQLHKRHSAD